MPDGKEQLIMLEGVYLPDEKIYCNKLIFSYRLTGKAVDINNVPKNICTKWFNYGRISRKLVLRRCMADDYICIGKGINKKMSRYMIDNKIPRRYRSNVMVLADGSRVLWIVGGRGSMDCYVDGSTEDVLQTEYTKV